MSCCIFSGNLPADGPVPLHRRHWRRVPPTVAFGSAVMFVFRMMDFVLLNLHGFIGVLRDQFFVPNVFTPNGDNKNAVMKVETNATISRFTIFNRFGDEIHSNTSGICSTSLVTGRKRQRVGFNCFAE
jgi:hypothetical protein